MKLRAWQLSCINKALEKYKNIGQHFLCLATPGAGKTLMSSVLAQKMFNADMIDLTICFSPSSIVADDFSASLELHTGGRFDGLLGAKGHSITYQSMRYLDNEFWQLFKNYRVLVIFDEIHHCSGDEFTICNAWGEHIVKYIKETATYTLSLTGTPWRTDATPITLTNYNITTNKAQCDFVYGLADAISEGVCRVPKIIALENDNISVNNGGACDTNYYNSISALIKAKVLPYSHLITNENIIEQLLKFAIQKLDDIRRSTPVAGGLIVAASVKHAYQLAKQLLISFGEHATVVTYQEDNPSQRIQNYRENNSKWIISVGMISEGTNIPRLQVCCHLSTIKTELYFRQILGRILRVTSVENQEAYLFMLNDPSLNEFALRVAEDIPEQPDIVTNKIDKGIDLVLENINKVEALSNNIYLPEKQNDAESKTLLMINNLKDNILGEKGYELSQRYDTRLDIYGQFKKEILNTGF